MTVHLSIIFLFHANATFYIAIKLGVMKNTIIVKLVLDKELSIVLVWMCSLRKGSGHDGGFDGVNVAPAGCA